MAAPREKLTLAELGDMEHTVTEARLRHAVAGMKRAKAMRRLGEIEATPLDDRTTEQHREYMATKRATREYERAMTEAENVAQDIEARVLIDQERSITDGEGAA